MKTIGLFIPARLNSQRLPRKLILPFAGTTLIDIALERMHRISYPCGKYFLAFEKEVADKNRYPDIETIIRSEDSANCDGPLLRSLGDLDRIREDYIAFMNPCFSILHPETMDKALRFFAESRCESMTSVVRHKNWFFDAETKRCLTTINYKELSTKKCTPVFAIGNAFHMTSKKSFFATGQFLDEGTHLHEIPYLESFDVDDLSGFIVAEALFQVREKIWEDVAAGQQ